MQSDFAMLNLPPDVLAIIREVAKNDQRYNRYLHGPIPSPTRDRTKPCIYEGKVRNWCALQGEAAELRHRRWCDHPDPQMDRSKYQEPDICTRVVYDTSRYVPCSMCTDFTSRPELLQL